MKYGTLRHCEAYSGTYLTSTWKPRSQLNRTEKHMVYDWRLRGIEVSIASVFLFNVISWHQSQVFKFCKMKTLTK